MPKKNTDKTLLKAWGTAVKDKAGYKCEYPDCNVNYTQTHPHHIFSRRHVSLRYSLDNGICLCPVHHTMGSFSAHKDPTFKDRLISTGVRSADLFEKLIKERNRIQKNNQAWKDECFERLKIYL
jgi:hypothetical protein